MSTQLLKRIGEFLYGDQWQAPLSREIGVGERSMRRWAAGTDSIPTGVWRDIALRLESVHVDADYLLSEVKGKLDLVEVHSFEKWDQGAGEMVRSPGKATAQRIARYGAQPISGTSEWVPAAHVDAEGRLVKGDVAAALSSDDYDLLEELSRRDGLARISGGRPRHGAERLVAAGYAVSRALNLSDVEYEITNLGRAALVLRQYGIRSTTFLIEPYRFDVDGRRYVRVVGAGFAPLMLETGSASKLVIHLRAAGAIELADRFDREIEQARQCDAKRHPHSLQVL